MRPFPREAPIDLTPYRQASTSDVAVYYGLPRNVQFCRNCVISNQRPASAIEYKHTRESAKRTIHFDEDGLCDACRVAERKNREIDWHDRERQLRELCARFRRTDGGYDCLIPGSGGKDSFYAAHKLKFEYGMHPLTVTWAPHLYTDWGRHNHNAWIDAGFDNVTVTPNGLIHRFITRLALENIFHPFQPFMLGQKALAPALALRFNIPLIFFGENEAEYGNPKEDMESAQRSWEYFAQSSDDSLYLAGVSLSDLQSEFGIDRNDLSIYLPPDPQMLADANVEVHYLGYYLKWHPQTCYYYAVEHGGFQASPERTAGTYSKYNSIDDKVDDLHYYTTFIKFGIGRATYDAAQEVRSGDIDRDEAVALVRRFDGEFPERFFGELCRYLSVDEQKLPRAAAMFEQPQMDRDYFLHLCDRFRSPHLWRWTGTEWRLRHTVWGQNE